MAQVIGLNGSGRAAMAADAELAAQVRPHGNRLRSVHSVTVPGAVDAWDSIACRTWHDSLGEALEPAIRLAEDGVPTTPRVAFDWQLR